MGKLCCVSVIPRKCGNLQNIDENLLTDYFRNVKLASRTWRKLFPVICFGYSYNTT